jgi:hypothetical protein
VRLATLLQAARGKSPLFWWRVLFAVCAAAFSLLLVLQPAPWRLLAEAGSLDNFGLTENVYFWTWWAGLGSIVIAAGLFLLAPWWANASAPDTPKQTPAPTPRWFWPLTLGAAIACAAIAGPTLTHSVWDDENESLSYYSLGRFLPDEKSGKPRFKTAAWRRTVFGYDTPNNHVFHNVLSRVSNSLWRSVAKPRGLQFNHVAIRLPAFLAALAGVVALALLLKQCGYAGAGVAAAWFLAIHPWFTEHAAVARGYTLVMLFVLLATMAWRRALLQGSWIWWFAFATAQFLAMWTYMGSFFVFACLNIAAAVLILTRNAPSPAVTARTQLSRWFCVNSITAAGLLPLLLPLVMQLRGYTATNNGFLLGAEWIKDVAWFFVAGAPWTRSSDTGSGHQDMQLVTQSLGSAAPWIAAALVASFFLVGLFLFLRRSRLDFALAASLLAAPVLQFLYARWETIFMWYWYVLYALPFVAMFWGLGMSGFSSWLARMTRRTWFAPAATAVVLVALAFLTHPVHLWQLARSKTPLLESVVATRPYPQDYRSAPDRRILTFSFSAPPHCYDPFLFCVRSAAEIVLLCRQADRESRPLAANIGHPHSIRVHHQAEFAILQDERLFARGETIPGAEEVWDRYVFFYRPNAASTVDLSELLDADEIAFVEKYAGTAPEKFFAAKVRPAPGGTTSGAR